MKITLDEMSPHYGGRNIMIREGESIYSVTINHSRFEIRHNLVANVPMKKVKEIVELIEAHDDEKLATVKGAEI